MRLPVASAMWMANSATSVFPAPVGADTMTDCPASIARIASSWKSSRENGYRARNCSSSSITRHSTTGGRLDPRWPRRSSRPLFSLLEARAGLYSAGRAMIVFHVAITAAEDYLTRREGYRRGHIERLQGLRAASILIGGGPAPDGKTADIFYRLQQPTQLKNAIEEDPYWTGGVWTRYERGSWRRARCSTCSRRRSRGERRVGPGRVGHRGGLSEVEHLRQSPGRFRQLHPNDLVHPADDLLDRLRGGERRSEVGGGEVAADARREQLQVSLQHVQRIVDLVRRGGRERRDRAERLGLPQQVVGALTRGDVDDRALETARGVRAGSHDAHQHPHDATVGATQRDLEVGHAPRHAEPGAQKVPPRRLDVELSEVPPAQLGGRGVPKGGRERFVRLEDLALAGRPEHAGEVRVEALALRAAPAGPVRPHRRRPLQSSSATRPSSDRGST